MSDFEQDEGIEIQARPEKPARLRTPVIIGAAAIIAGIVIVTVIFAFSRPAFKAHSENYEIPVTDVKSSANEALSLLPKDYDQMPPDELLSAPPQPAIPSPPPQYNPVREEDLALQKKALESSLFFDGQNGAGSLRKTVNSPGSALPQAGDHSFQGRDNYAQDLPPEDQQNLQGQKLGFLNQFKGQDEFILNDRLHAPLSAYEVKSGTLISAALITAINSDLPGDVIAQVSEHVYDTVTGNFLLIPQGSRLYGRYDSVISYGQERVLVAWQRLVLPNGKSIKLDGMIAADPAGASGLEDQVDNHFLRLAGAVLLSTAVSLSGNLANDDDDDSIGSDVGDTVAQEASRVGQKFVSKAINIQPTLKIRGGAEVRVFVNKDMILEPYESL